LGLTACTASQLDPGATAENGDALTLGLDGSTLLTPPNFAGGVTDYRSVPETRVTLPAAGSYFTDPDFHTRIIRVTNAASLGASDCQHSYSVVPAMNLDSTYVLANCNGLRVFRLDKTTDHTTYVNTVTAGQPYTINWESAYWSNVSPNILYVLGNNSGQRHTKIFRVDVTRTDAGRFTVLKDLTGVWSGSWNLWQLSVSWDDNVFSFHARDTSGNYYRTGAYIKSTNHFMSFPDTTYDVDESYVEKGGRYINIIGKGANAYQVKTWNLSTNGVMATLTNSSTNKTGGHYDLGSTYWVNGDRYLTGSVVRTWTGITSPRNVFQYKTSSGSLNWAIADHISMRNADESFFLTSTYGSISSSWPAFQHEIVLVKTNGGGFSRVAHTRSTGAADSYWSQPRAVIDHDGRYVVFTSDNGTTQTDVYILKLPQ
jgi:hypothetical protein